MITGVDYVFYSNKKPFDIEKNFISLLNKKWNNPIIDELERSDFRLELFFSKDKEMYSFFDLSAYSLNKNNEGCFMLISTKLERLECKIKILNILYPESRKNTEPYNSTIMLSDIWEYTLILPSEITSNNFSKDIFLYLKKVIR